jgi:tetratricopeptide (TPR) repeat protein
MPKSKNRRRKKPASQAALTTDVQLLEALLSQIDLIDTDEDLDAAQEIMLDAWETSNPRRRLALAKQALEISPLCADAYLMLGEQAKTTEEAIALYRKGVEAGEQALGPAAFAEYAGDFWGLIETRPYMRVRHMLAVALWDTGEREEPLAHWQDLLRLNPTDNQGARYLLLDALLEQGRDEDAGALLRRYNQDPSAAWAWSHALLSFRRKGDCADSRYALAEAIEVNRHVPPYLSGKKSMPRKLPDYMGWGDPDEAVAYVHGAARAWAATEGAVKWAREFFDSKPRAMQDEELRQMSLDITETLAPGFEQIDDAVLALLLLGRHNGNRVWKSFDWAAMDRLHQKGYITSPVGKAKSVVLTDEGLEQAEQRFKELFPKAAERYL